MSDSPLHEEKEEEKVLEDLDCDESLLEPAVELSTEENETEAGDDNFFPFANLAVEINEDVEENAATSETVAENEQDLSNMSEDACNPETEEAVADSTIPESNESSHDATTYENNISIKSEPENLEDMPETNLADFIYSSTPVTFDEGSNSTSDEAKEDMIKKPQLYRFPKVVKAVEMAEYETLQMIYQLLYQRSAWDTQEILKQRILEFSGFNFSESSEEYFNRDMMLKTQPNEVLVKIGHVLGLEQIRNMYSGGDKARFDLISAIMKFLTSMKSLVKPRRRTTYAKSNDPGIEPSPKNLITKCGCRARCLAKTPKSQRVAFLQYLKELENKNILDSYLYNLIDIKHNARKPGEDKQKFREYAYTFKVRFGTREFSVCKGGFAVYHGLKQRKLQTMQNKLKTNAPLPPKMDLDEFPPFNVPPKVSPRKSWSETSSYGTSASNQTTFVPSPSIELKTYSAVDTNTPKLEGKTEIDTEKNQQKLVMFKRKSWEREDMLNALKAVRHENMGCGLAGKEFNVPRSTLKRYVAELGDQPIEEFLDSKLGGKYFTVQSSKETCVVKDEVTKDSDVYDMKGEDENSKPESESTNEENSEKKKLKEFPLVVTAIEGSSKELLIDVHFLLFLNGAEDEEVKKNILNFSGFTFKPDTEEYDERNEFLQRMSFKIVGDVARSFSLEIKENKEDTIKNILEFLQKPMEKFLTITSSMPLSLSDVELDDIDGFSDSDESITCEVVEKKVECIDLISSGEDSDEEKSGKTKSPKKAASSDTKIVKNDSSSKVPSPSQQASSIPPTISQTPSSSSQSGQRALKDFETISKIVNTHPHEYLIDIYDLLYLKKHEPSTLRQDILNFTGFTFEKGTTDYVKRKQLLDRMLYNSVRRIYNTLIHNTTEVKVFSKPTMITEIFQFLFKLPDHDTSVRQSSTNKTVMKPGFGNSPKNAPVATIPPPGVPLINQSGKLSDLKRVFQRVACFPCEYLIDVHKLLFMTDCDPKVIRQNIFAFKGFNFGPESQDFQQRKMYLEYLTFHSLRKISSVLTTRSVDLRNSTKHELATHLTQVLAEYCNTYSDTEIPSIKNNNNQSTTVTSSSNSNQAVENIVVTPSLDPSFANPPVEPIPAKVAGANSSKSIAPKNAQASPLAISIVDARSVPPQAKRKRKTSPKKVQEKKQPEGNQFADIHLPEVEKYRQIYGQSIYNPNLPTITGITTFNTTGIPQTFPIGQTMSFPYVPVQTSQVIGVPVISQVQGNPSEVIVPGESAANDEESASKKQKVSDKNEKTPTKNNEDEEDCDKPLSSLIGHPIDSVLKKNIADIVEQTNLQDITINGVIQKIYGMYPKFDLSYRKEFIKSTVRSLLYKLGEQNIKSANNGANSPDCSVSTTDIQDNSLDETSMECSS